MANPVEVENWAETSAFRGSKWRLTYERIDGPSQPVEQDTMCRVINGWDTATGVAVRCGNEFSWLFAPKRAWAEVVIVAPIVRRLDSFFRSMLVIPPKDFDPISELIGRAFGEDDITLRLVKVELVEILATERLIAAATGTQPYELAPITVTAEAKNAAVNAEQTIKNTAEDVNRLAVPAGFGLLGFLIAIAAVVLIVRAT